MTKGTFHLASERLSDQFREGDVALVSMELFGPFDSRKPLAPYIEVEENHRSLLYDVVQLREVSSMRKVLGVSLRIASLFARELGLSELNRVHRPN